TVSEAAFLAAAHLVADYLMPMAERVYGDAACRPEDRNAATLARWIIKTRPPEVYVRHLQREVRLPGLGDADSIRAAAGVLAEAERGAAAVSAGQADDIEQAEAAAIRAVDDSPPAPGAPWALDDYRRCHARRQAELSGLLAAGLLRPPSWADAEALPTAGCHC